MMSILLKIMAGVMLLGLFVIAVMLAPEEESFNYWVSIAWIALLVSANWFATGRFFSSAFSSEDKHKNDYLMGSLPGISTFLFIYSMVSICTLLASSWLEYIDWNNQLMLQVAALIFATVVVGLMLLATKGAQHGTETVVTKSQILTHLRRLERVSADPEAVGFLRDTVNFVNSKMPHPSNLDQLLLAEVLDELDECDPNDLGKIKSTLSRVRNL
jgi:hypothetical protein